MSTLFRKLSRTVVSMALGLTWSALSGAQTPPARFDPQRPPSLQTGPAAVHVDASGLTSIEIQAADGRRYTLWVASIGQQPAHGWPLLLLLDGRAAIYDLLHSPAGARPVQPVLLAALGSPNPGYYDVTGRAYDYTPDRGDGRPIMDPRQPSRRAGGAEAFLQTLQGPVQHALATRWKLDPQHRGIWGHSYGGLFTLYSLFRHSEAFQFYAPTSPSLWWHAPLPQQLAEQFASKHSHATTCVLLSHGSAEGQPGQHHPSVTAANPPSPSFGDAELVEMLRPSLGPRLQWHTFSGLSHGETFPASLGPAIRAFAAWSAGAKACGFDDVK